VTKRMMNRVSLKAQQFSNFLSHPLVITKIHRLPISEKSNERVLLYRIFLKKNQNLQKKKKIFLTSIKIVNFLYHDFFSIQTFKSIQIN